MRTFQKFCRLTAILTTLILCAHPSSQAHAAEDFELYFQAKKFTKSKSLDFAFMKYRALVKNYPDSKHYEEALFAIGEYYMSVPDYKRAQASFQEYVTRYPESKAKIFALAYLLNIANAQNNAEMVSALQDEIVTLHRVSLVFRKSKKFVFKSPLLKKYRAEFQIDQVHFYINGRLFQQITY